jgi:hypothetical protein
VNESPGVHALVHDWGERAKPTMHKVKMGREIKKAACAAFFIYVFTALKGS